MLKFNYKFGENENFLIISGNKKIKPSGYIDYKVKKCSKKGFRSVAN